MPRCILSIRLQSVVISNNGKRIIRLKDFAEIAVKEAIEYTKINANGRESILVAIIKQPNANLIDLSEQMESKVAELQKILPAGITLKPYYVQADFVNDAVKSVTESVMDRIAAGHFCFHSFSPVDKSQCNDSVHDSRYDLPYADLCLCISAIR